LKYLFEAEKIAEARKDKKHSQSRKKIWMGLIIAEAKWQAKSFEIFRGRTYRIGYSFFKFYRSGRVSEIISEALYYVQQNYDMAYSEV